eukprot:TRINITY_DN19048_c0_g1_i1.p1 TRINITY_DN19048_c0_g1~~TRINITY_DN19048_c0_g1_i1.p1  ORF type:complete len:246 (+),score=86.51 TRINITY_DN19048_c0_g1_i1:78-815(+)
MDGAPGQGYWGDEGAVEEWLRDQKCEEDAPPAVALPAGAAEAEAEGSSETVSTVCGEAQVLEALEAADGAASVTTDDGFTTVDGEEAMIEELQKSNASSSGGCTTLPGEVEALAVLERRLPADAPQRATKLAACIRSILHREGRYALCFLDGRSVYVGHYEAHLARETARLGPLLASLPPHLPSVSLPDPPEIPPPTENSTPLHVRNYNRAALQTFKTWLPADPERGGRQHTIDDTLAFYGMASS